MLTAVKGYYDGEHVVIDPNDKKRMQQGQELIITLLDMSVKPSGRAEKRKKFLREQSSVIPSGRTAEEIDAELEAIRNDRF